MTDMSDEYYTIQELNERIDELEAENAKYKEVHKALESVIYDLEVSLEAMNKLICLM